MAIRPSHLPSDSTPGSVSILIARFKKGDREALVPLWERYYPRLVALARKHLDKRMRRVVDGEDVAATAFQSFCAQTNRGVFTQLHDRSDLWSLLVAITMHKVMDERRRQHRGKRTVDRTVGATDLSDAEARDAWLELPDPELTPDAMVIMEDQMNYLLNRLQLDKLRTVATLRLHGHTVPEIAERMGCVTRTVERRLESIRLIWAEEFEKVEAP